MKGRGIYGKLHSLYHTKFLLSFLFWMNTSSSLIMFVVKDKTIEIAWGSINGFPVSFPIFLAASYIGLTLFFPREKVFEITLEKKESKKYLRIYALYVSLSILFMVLTAALGKK